MVTAAIAYDELAAHDPAIIDQVMKLMAAHPDKGPFEVAIGRSTGAEKTRRIFLEMARWSDDIRGGAYDHPTWHYAFRPVVDRANPPPHPPPEGLDGEIREAFALNLRIAGDPQAPAADRAVALCWLFHLAGDVHQPLHNAQLFSAKYPDGDHGGGAETVTDPPTGEPVALHWFWDDSVNRLGEPEPVVRRGHELEAKFPRASLADLNGRADPQAFAGWADESYRLAESLAYRPGALEGPEGRTLNPAYAADVTAATERRVALAGYRLADILRLALGRR
jgi:hypothetical protein